MATYLIGGKLIDGVQANPISNVAVGFKDNKISFIGTIEELNRQNSPDDKVIDVGGKSIIPGLINMHEHLLYKQVYGPPRDHMKKDPTALVLFGIKTILTSLRNGFTTVRDMASLHGIILALREAIKEGELPGPRILTCNQPLSATGGHASYLCVETDGADNVRKAARNQLKLGADFIKVMASHDPFPMSGKEQTRAEFTLNEMRAAFEEAHKWGKHAGCHAMGRRAILNCIEAGANVLEHGAYLDKKLANLMVEREVYYTPTLSAYTRQTMNPQFGRGEVWKRNHESLIKPIQEAFCIALEEGVKIVCGTDSTGRYAEEVELMRLLGMGAMESLQACTIVPAKALNLSDLIGSIEVGKLADIVVIEEDPLRDPYALEKVEMVIKEGKVYRPNDIKLP